ncbi:MAG: hypothetical protein K0U52_10375, partial [Gammaproteobacteria bacterium]|nr:hypothetical protein [Gammaproteobacteria bacterium]
QVFDKVTKKTTVRKKSFRRIKNGEAHKREMFKKACEFRKKKQKEYVDALEEYYTAFRARQSHWFARRELKEVFEEASRN